MARVSDHLSISDVERRCRGCPDPVKVRHVQAIWLLAQGHTVGATSKVTAFGPRWIEPLVERYKASGPVALANGRRHNGLKPSLLTPDMLEAVRLRLAEALPDGGLWSSRKVADVMAAHFGLERVLPHRGWEALKALGWSLQRPRPENPKSATAEEAAAFKNTGGRRRRGCGGSPRHAGRGVLHRRSPPRPEAGAARGVGPQGRAPDRAGPPPLPVALRDGFRGPGHGRDGVVPRPTPCPSRCPPACSTPSPAGSGAVPANASCCCSTTPAGTPCPTSSSPTASGWSTCRPRVPTCTLRSLPQPASQVVGPCLLRPPRRSGPGGRAGRRHLRPQPRRAHRSHHRAMHQPHHPPTRHQLTHRLRLVACQSHPELISRAS